MTEEFKGQTPLYEKFIQSGHTILDLCDADSKDASHISEKMDVISKDWSRLEARLQERGRALKSVEGLSLEFNDIMKTVQDWIDDFSDRVGNITPGTLSPEENQNYLEELQVKRQFVDLSYLKILTEYNIVCNLKCLILISVVCN